MVLMGIHETAFLITPEENAVYPAIAPFTAFWANLEHIIVSSPFAATDLIAYVGSMYLRLIVKLYFSLIVFTILSFKHSPISSSFIFPDPSFFTAYVIFSFGLISPSSAPSATTITACP